MFTVSHGYFNFECLNLLQNDFCKQRYITLNATISGQDRIYPKTHLCRTFGVGVPCRILYCFVDYLYVNGSGSITHPNNLFAILTCYYVVSVGEVTSSSGCLGWATLFYYGTP